MSKAPTLRQFLVGRPVGEATIPGDLVDLVCEIARACKSIGRSIDRAGLAGGLGSAGTRNVQGETQKKLDVLSNDILVEIVGGCGLVAGVVSEEMDQPFTVAKPGRGGNYLALFDPLDGSSNIDVNISVGTIFSVLPNPQPGSTPDSRDFLQAGRDQVCAGFVLYGPATVLVLTTGQGTDAFTLDSAVGEFMLSRQAIAIPADTQEFAINASNQRFWELPVQRYIEECLLGDTGPRGKNFNMRWVASMVADVYRVLWRGGVFLYPKDNKDPTKAGKLRLMYEANPMGLLVEQAGGGASTGRRRILDIEPEHLHQRVPVVLGSSAEVALLDSYHR